MFCTKCGKEVSGDMGKCPNCGKVLKVAAEKKGKKKSDTIIYMIIAVLVIFYLFSKLTGCSESSESSSHEKAVEILTYEDADEYVSTCYQINLDDPDFQRNIDQYVGHDVVVASTVFYEVTGGLFRIGDWEGNMMSVNCDDAVVFDNNFNTLNRVIYGDKGLVAGVLIDDNTIEAKLVVITEPANY